ncbi:hypothetical protein N9K20_04890 [Methylophilaceae bacterium]|nr:hypothetical protein [Methylophilaceae bacterium]
MSRKPATRARSSTSFGLNVCPTYSKSIGVSCAIIFITDTSIGGFGSGGDFLSHAVNNNEVIKQVKKMSFFFIITSLNIRN